MNSFDINGTPLSYPDVNICPFIVNSHPHPYLVSCCPLDAIAFDIHNCKHPLILIDSKVYDLYRSKIKWDKNIALFKVYADEENKTIDVVLDVADFLLCNNATKSSCAYVIGGGIIQDIGAFACAIYKRGIPWKLIPTTLLSQADSCIGGKTALNCLDTKNVLGLFSAPSEVLICNDFLSTLDYDAIASGVGEMIKLGIIGGSSTFQDMTFHLFNDPYAPRVLDIFASLQIKKSIIERDEFEQNIRQSLNYGHSFGHALERMCDFQIPHGIAVMLGMLVEDRMTNTSVFYFRETLLQICKPYLTTEIWETFNKTNFTDIVSYMQKDKKVCGNVLKLPSFTSPGHCEIVDFILDEEGDKTIQEAIQYVKDQYALP